MDAITQLALAFGAAVLAGAVARHLGQSVVPAYVLAGIALGPPGLGLVTDDALLQPLSLLGLVLLLFFMGLESSTQMLTQAPRRTAKDGAINFVLNFVPPVAIGLAFGWDPLLSLFLGLACYTTSSGIAVKSIIELRRTANADTGVVMNLMVVEDLSTAVLLATLAGVAFTGSTDPVVVAGAAVKAFAVCAAFLLVVRPLVLHWGQRGPPRPHMRSQELFLLGLLAMVFGAAALAEGAGLSAALGAFLLGLVLADSAHGPRLREGVVPMRDATVAAFFFAFGMMLDLGGLGSALPLLLVLLPVTIATKFLTGWLIASGRGTTPKARLNIATTLVPRGEFSIVAANTAAAAGIAGPLGAVVGIMVVVTAVLGSVLMAATGRLLAVTQHRTHFHATLARRVKLAARRRTEALRAGVSAVVPGVDGELGRSFR